MIGWAVARKTSAERDGRQATLVQQCIELTPGAPKSARDSIGSLADRAPLSGNLSQISLAFVVSLLMVLLVIFLALSLLLIALCQYWDKCSYLPVGFWDISVTDIALRSDAAVREK